MFLKSLTLGVPNYTTVGVPACSQVVAEILRDIPKPENFDWVAEMDAHNTEEQDNGQIDPCLPSQSVELPQGQGSSRQKFEQWSFQSDLLYKESRSLSRRLSAEPATRTLQTPSLVTAPNPRRWAIAIWGLSGNVCSGTGINQHVVLCGWSEGL